MDKKAAMKPRKETRDYSKHRHYCWGCGKRIICDEDCVPFFEELLCCDHSAADALPDDDDEW